MKTVGVTKAHLRARAIEELCREYQRACVSVLKTSAARAAIPPGGSRARVTTANARWSTACEHRDRIEARLRDEYGVELHVRLA